MSTISPPCAPFPEVPGEVKVTLPFGELQAFRDFSQGLPSDCTLTFNLLLQLPPLLASLTCPLRVLKVIKALQDFAKAATDPPSLFSALPKLAAAIEEVSECLPPGIYLSFHSTIKDILLLILRFLKCLLDEMKSILRLQLSIDLKSAEGNPVLLNTLLCAQNNAQLSMEHLTASIGPIQPLMDIVSEIAGIVELPLNLPSLAGSTPAGNDLQSFQDTINNLDQFVTQLKQIVEAI